MDVFYGTDRKLLPSEIGPCAASPSLPMAVRFGRERGTGALSLGVFPVKLPAGVRLGETPPAIERPMCPPASDGVFLAGAVPKSEEEFAESVRRALRRAVRKEILIFVHGYDYAFDEAVLWAAQLKNDLRFQGVIVLYSWPSRGNRWSYLADLNSAEWTTPHLARFLDALVSQTGGVPIHVLAHSMGSRATLSALYALAVERRDRPAPRFKQIIFAAADVDADVFRQLAPPVLALAERVTLYTAADLPLGIAGWLFAHPRAGDSVPGLVLVAGMDTVDVTAVDDSRTRHRYFLENERVLADIFQLLSYAAPPEGRFRLFSFQVRGIVAWQFRS